MKKLQKEICRKFIHIGSLALPVSYYLNTKELVITINLYFLLCMAVFEYLRLSHYSTISKAMSFLRLDQILRKHEEENLTGASYMAISSILAVLIFPREVYIAAFSILSISDSFAALVGMKYGRTKILNKSLEGSAAFFFSSIICLTTVYYLCDSSILFLLLGICSCLATTIAELLAKKIKIDDNLIIPLTFGFSMYFALIIHSIANPL